MKYIVLLADGMADYPLKQLNGMTPMQKAYKPNMDRLACEGTTGLAYTIPNDLPPGSDVANLSVLGYDPIIYYTGRSPIEAVSMGIDLNINDLSLRMNLVTLSDEADFENKRMIDYCAGEISSEKAGILVKSISDELSEDRLEFYPGVSYRHCMISRNNSFDPVLIPPHDISGKIIDSYLPKGERSKFLKDLMVKSYNILNDHPVNIERKKQGLNPANCIWLWGPGKKPALPLFKDKYGLKGCVISAVDLVKGLGILTGMKSVNVKGATGNIDTNYVGKADAALEELSNGCDFVYIHVEAPDECGHRGEIENKVKAIELIDKLVLGRILDKLFGKEDFRIMVLPDHPTPLELRTHTSDPVPFLIYDSLLHKPCKTQFSFNEFSAKKGIRQDTGHLLMNMFIKGTFY